MQVIGLSSVALVVKNPPTNAIDPGDMSLTPESGRSPRGGRSNPSNILA